MAVAHRHRMEEAKRVELDTEITGSGPRRIRCLCDELFYAAEINPVCPACGRTLILDRRTG